MKLEHGVKRPKQVLRKELGIVAKYQGDVVALETRWETKY